jgi:hypothetical protein
MKKFTLIFSIAVMANLLLGSTAFAQITVRGTATTTTTTGTTLTLSRPVGLQQGDVMVVTITQADNDHDALSNAARTGWTVIDGRVLGSSGDNEWWGTVLYKIADMSDIVEGTYDFTLDDDADDGVGGIVAFAGVDNANPFSVASGTINTGNSDDLSATAKSPTTTNSAIVMLGMVGDNRTLSNWNTTSPGALTELFENSFDATNLDMAVGGAWAIKAATGSTGTGTAEIDETGNDVHGSIIIALRAAAAPPATAASLWATSSNGTRVSAFAVSNGAYISGATDLFTPTTGAAGSTAALGRNDIPSAANGFFYWLPNSGTNGVVNIYASNSTGGSQTLISTFDVNGAGNDSTLGFVRLGMGPDGKGWILAGNGVRLYLVSFQSNGTSAVVPTVVDDNVTLTGGAAATFQNGDICVSGTGALYALANNGSGLTQIFIGSPNGASTNLTKRWDLVDPSNTAFTGSVNGVAFDAQGSLYISTATGLYYIDDNTVNGPAGTVQCDLVRAIAGLQDLASNVFPTETTLPVRLNSFTGSLYNNIATLNWDASSETNFSHYEIQRSSNGSSFATIGNKSAAGGTGRNNYQYADNLAVVSGNVFYYRLKIVDLDGRFEYSSVIMVRKDQKSMTGLAVNPNPVVGGIATVRFSSSSNGIATVRVVDMTGKVVLQQQNKVAEGVNSIPVNNPSLLQKGTYILQVQNGEELTATKFSVVR